jgi:hypothetical protein
MERNSHDILRAQSTHTDSDLGRHGGGKIYEEKNKKFCAEFSFLIPLFPRPLSACNQKSWLVLFLPHNSIFGVTSPCTRFNSISSIQESRTWRVLVLLLPLQRVAAVPLVLAAPPLAPPRKIESALSRRALTQRSAGGGRRTSKFKSARPSK